LQKQVFSTKILASVKFLPINSKSQKVLHPEPLMELEYKIIQAQTPLFASTPEMHEILDEEAQAGWRLLEKEDNYRLKLQREISYRENDKNLSADPYRTTVGVSSVVTYGATAAVTVAVVSVILYLALWSQN
jgi:hypothetical protein